MSPNSITHRTILAASIAIMLACSTDRTTAPDPAPLPQLSAATWRVHEADGQPLPALVSHHLEMGVLVQLFLDSALVNVDAAGRWEQRLWLTRYRAGVPDGSVAEQDAGSWKADDTAYRFTSDINGPRFAFGAITADSLVVSLRSPAVNGVMVSTLRESAPPASPVGAWRANAVANLPVPSPIYVFDSTVVNGDTVSVHFIVDSAKLTLHPTGRYDHWIRYSEWHGPVRGAPTQLRFRWAWNDFGTWTRTGVATAFESGYYQNHRMTGEFGTVGPLRVSHGLSAGDDPAVVRYVRE